MAEEGLNVNSQPSSVRMSKATADSWMMMKRQPPLEYVKCSNT